jgi:type VI protein secretion system component Hcp
MRKGLLFATPAVVALVAAAALFGLIGPEGAVGAGQPAQVVGTLVIEGLTPANEPIDVLAYSWGVSNSGTIGTPGGGGGAGKANIQDLSFTKAFDTLSPDIIDAVVLGEHFASATLLVNATGQPGKPTHRYEIGNLIFTSASHGGSGGQRMTENVTFNFATFELTNE